MTIAQAQDLILKLQPNPALPPMKRNKSWLFVFADTDKELHFYDTKSSPAEAFARISVKQPTYKLLDVLAFTSPDEATSNAINMRSACETIRFYQKQIV
jgi:hypothetical protein